MKHRCIFCPVQVLHGSRLDPGHSASQTRVNALKAGVGRDDSGEFPSQPDSAGLLNQAISPSVCLADGKEDRQTSGAVFPDIDLFHPDILPDDSIIVRHVVGGNG